MADAQVRQFGVPPSGEQAVERPGAYGVVFDAACADRILLVQWRQRYFLPGGGVHLGESFRQAFVRELLEEAGQEPLSMGLIGSAGQYVRDAATGRWWNKRCTFFMVRVGPRIKAPADQDHEPAWILARDAATLLHEEASAWAVQRALRRLADV